MEGKDSRHEARAKPSVGPGSVTRPGWHAGRVFRFDLPMPPSANTYYRVANGIVHISRAGRQFRDDVYFQLLSQFHEPLTCRIGIHGVLHFASRRRSDIDNRMKPLLDALEHARVIEDDSQVDVLRIDRGAVVSGGRCCVALTELLEEQQQLELETTGKE